MSALLLNFSEYWMYHHPSYPWDVSDFYAEAWNGMASGPSEDLDRTQVTGVHYAPVFAYYPGGGLIADNWFWCLESTGMSAGGWPSILCDNGSASNSYFSDDFYSWETSGSGNYFIRCDVTLAIGLDRTTWGEIKAIF
jgi:hypothetical protein